MDTDKKRIGYCREMARKILKESGNLIIPVPIKNLAEHYGFTIVELDQPPDKFSGILHREKKAIGINEHHHVVRQRFSIGHELGHYFLDHPTADEEYPDDEGISKRNIYESEADEFAAEILVPRQLLQQALSEKKDIESLRELFKVSRQVITIQLSKHGFLMKI